jgi:hypothetical protein
MPVFVGILNEHNGVVREDQCNGIHAVMEIGRYRPIVADEVTGK